MCSQKEDDCIPLIKVCDDKPDCLNGTDETGPGCKETNCNRMNGGCSQLCFETPTGKQEFFFLFVMRIIFSLAIRTLVGCRKFSNYKIFWIA